MNKLPYILATLFLVGCFGHTLPAPANNPKPAVVSTKPIDDSIANLKKQLASASSTAEKLRILNKLADDKAVKIFEGQ